MKLCPDFLHSGPDVPWINPECTGIANLPPRAHLNSFENEAQALDGDPEHSAIINLWMETGSSGFFQNRQFWKRR